MDRSEITDSHFAFRREDFPDLGVREVTCPSHGTYQAKGRMLGKREIWTTCQSCIQESEAANKEEAARAEAERAERRRRDAIGQACIPARFQGRSFDGYSADLPEQRAALAKVRDYVENFPDHLKRGTGLVLAGKPGTGKTHLAAAAMLELLSPKTWVQYVTCMTLIRMVRETWGKSAERDERAVIQMLGEKIDLLVIDEVGVQYGTESEQHILFEVLDRRYAEMRPTILITNQDKANFKALIGERIADRLTQTHDWLAFGWASYRREARESQA